MSCGNRKVTFYDLKAKKKFSTSNYGIIEKQMKNGRKAIIAVADSPHSDVKGYRILKNVKK